MRRRQPDSGQSYLDLLSNGLGAVIGQALEGLVPEDADALENASQMIRFAFAQGFMPANIQQEIQQNG